MKIRKTKSQKRATRRLRGRAKIVGSSKRPRLSVFRSSVHIYGQLIDDASGKTLLATSDLKIKKEAKETKTKIAEKVGEDLAKKAISKKIKTVVFDRGGFKFHGRVKALAEGARKGGLKF